MTLTSRVINKIELFMLDCWKMVIWGSEQDGEKNSPAIFGRKSTVVRRDFD